MHPKVEAHLLQVFARHPAPGLEVLEVGAHPASSEALARGFPGCTYTGLNLAVEGSYEWGSILLGNGNEMVFADDSFDAVVCNATLEHDRFFWKTLGEVRRVMRPGGIFYCGVPGYASRSSFRIDKAIGLQTRLSGRPGFAGRLAVSGLIDGLAGVATYPFHLAPDDFYRFSEQAVRRVLLDGFEVLEVRTVLRLPRIIGVGRKQ